MTVKVGLIQDSPVFFDKEATLKKVAQLTSECAEKACDLVVFPESFVPGYPRGFDFGAKIGRRTKAGRALYREYHEQSIDLDGPDKIRLEKLSKEKNIYLVLGATEKKDSNGSLYCSMIYISPKEGLLGVHRKIRPTGTERLVWAEAGGESLISCDTEIGKLGGLICWENYMPHARVAMYQQGVQIYIAPTADSRESWTATMRHIALEGRCFVLGCNQYFTKSMYPAKYGDLVMAETEELCPGGSIIVSPMGEIIEGPLFGKKGILMAELDLNLVTESKLDFDTNGHYTRKDIFKFDVVNQPKQIIEKKKTK